jgi:hypothetical protein
VSDLIYAPIRAASGRAESRLIFSGSVGAGGWRALQFAIIQFASATARGSQYLLGETL